MKQPLNENQVRLIAALLALWEKEAETRERLRRRLFLPALAVGVCAGGIAVALGMDLLAPFWWWAVGATWLIYCVGALACTGALAMPLTLRTAIEAAGFLRSAVKKAHAAHHRAVVALWCVPNSLCLAGFTLDRIL